MMARKMKDIDTEGNSLRLSSSRCGSQRASTNCLRKCRSDTSRFLKCKLAERQDAKVEDVGSLVRKSV